MSASGTISPSDQALLAAFAAWAGAEEPALLLRLGHQRARTLLEAKRTVSSVDPITSLQASHEAQITADPSRVHPSWYVRALQDESPAVQRSVAEAAEEPLRSILLRELRLAAAELKPDRPPDPEVLQIAQTLWTERLVGDLPSRDDDPPAINALVRLSERRLYQLHRLMGLAKLSMLDDLDREQFGRANRSRLHHFAGRLAGPIDPRLARLARNDWTASQPFGRHALAGLGLTTLGRLLGQADPHRLRWALQHRPYSIAKRLRVAASQPQAMVKAVIAWEGRFLDLALERLDFEILERSIT